MPLYSSQDLESRKGELKLKYHQMIYSQMYAGRPGKDVADGDDVIFPFLDAFWLCKLVSPAKISLTKKSTPGLFFQCRHPLGAGPACGQKVSSSLI